MRSADDLSARARIRDAAILRFARDGFGVPVRAIASDAGVSAALVIHHFGSKSGLRAATDAAVLERIREAKLQHIDTAAADRRFFEAFATAEQYGPLIGYVLRSLNEGGDVGREFLAHMLDDAEQYTARAVASGVARPSRDEAARARYLTLSALGSLSLSLSLDPPADPSDLTAVIRRFFAESYLPMIELYTEGLLTTRRLLDDYLAYVPDPPSDPASDPRSDPPVTNPAPPTSPDTATQGQA